MLNGAFDEWAENPELDLYPAELRDEMDELNARVYETVNNGVYRAGFAKTQEAYEEAIPPMFDDPRHARRAARRDAAPVRQRDDLADWRLFTTLLRFDPVYYLHFKCNLRRIVDYPNLWGYLRDLYQHPGRRATRSTWTTSSATTTARTSRSTRSGSSRSAPSSTTTSRAGANRWRPRRPFPSLDRVKVSTRTLIAGAIACAGLFCAILVLAYLSHRARELDLQALEGFLGLQNHDSYVAMRKLGHLGDAKWVILQALILVGIALLRGRPRLAFAVVALVGVTSVSSQLLKALFAYPRLDGDVAFVQVAAKAFPSGHSTAAMAIAIAGVLVAPQRIRPVAAVAGCALALTVGFAVVSTGSHFPSDVAGGFLLAATWGIVIALALRAADARWPERAVPGRAAAVVRRATDAVTATGLTAAVLAGAVLLAVVVLAIGVTRPGEIVELARDHTAALLVGSALAALAMTLLTGITLGLRRRN